MSRERRICEPSPSRRGNPPCPCGCGSRGLCAAHKARLAGIKAEVAVKRSRRHGEGWGPTCCTAGCYNPRRSGSALCDECLESAE